MQIIADLEICFKCPKLRALDKTDTSASRFECAWLDRSSFQQSNPQTLGLSRKRLFLRKAAENGIHPEMISVRTKWKQHFDTCKTSSTLLSSFSWKVFDSNPHKISFIWFEAATVSLWVSTKMVLHPAINRAFGSLGNPDDDQPLIERWSTLIQSSLISQGRVHGEPGFICRPSVPVQPLRQGENDDWNFTLLNRLPLFVYLCLPSFTLTQMYRKIRIGKKTARLGYVRNVALLPEFFSDTGTTVVPLWQITGGSCTCCTELHWHDIFLWNWHVTCRFDIQDASAIYWWGSTLCLSMKITSNRETRRSMAHAAQCSTCNASQMQRLLWGIYLDLSILQNDLLLLMRWRPSVAKNADTLAFQDFPPTVCKASKNTVF